MTLLYSYSLTISVYNSHPPVNATQTIPFLVAFFPITAPISLHHSAIKDTPAHFGHVTHRDDTSTRHRSVLQADTSPVMLSIPVAGY